jgi:hypothetical protein
MSSARPWHQQKETTVASTPVPRGRGRRAVLGSLALAAVGTPLAITQPWARAATPLAAPLWSPDPVRDGVNAFEGVEADRANKHPGRKYVYTEGDHWRFDIYRNDLDSTGNHDRQRTEVKGMVAGGRPLKMTNGQTWRITYEMFMPATLHGTSHFTHIFQLKTPATNGGPWVTMSLSRSGSAERLRLRAFSTPGSPDIGSTNLAPLREKWISVELTFTIGPRGTGRLLIRDGGSVVVDSSRAGVNIPDQNDYVRPKWGIYRSIQSASSDIIDTHLLFRNFKAYHEA